MRGHFLEAYDAEWCSALYELYESGDDSVLNELLTKLCPLVRQTYLHEVGKSLAGDQELIEADALLEVYRVVEEKFVPNGHPKVFSKFLRTVVVRSIRDSIRTMKKQTFDYWKVGKDPSAEQLPSGYHAEQSIYEEQVRAAIRDAVRSRIRFFGKERKACEFILDCWLGYKFLEPKVARRVFELSSHRTNYLIRYIRILTKAVAYERRDLEYKSGPLSSEWEASRSILRTPGEFG